MSASEMRRCLETCDVQEARRLWAHAMPHLPQPTSDAQALIILHRARTEMESIAIKLRAYSHRWLLDNGHASGLPDKLKPSAERLYPKVVGAVGVSLGGKSELALAIKPHIMGAMTDSINDCYANGDEDPLIVKPRMFEARAKEMKRLLGRLS